MPRPCRCGIGTLTVGLLWVRDATVAMMGPTPLDDERPRMDFDDTPDEAAYRATVRGLLEEHAAELLHLAPGEEAPDARTHEAELRRTERVLAEAGLVGITWPREYGGEGGAPGEEGDRREGGHHAPRPR